MLEILDLLAYWTEKVSGQTPSELENYLIKSVPNLKGAVRTSVCNTIVSSYIHNERATVLSQPFYDFLCKSYEKSSSQITQVRYCIFSTKRLIMSCCKYISLFFSF